MPDKKVNYRDMRDELDEIVADLQQEDLDVDAAMQKYERGLQLVKQLEVYLKSAENKVTKLKLQFKAGDKG